MEAGVELRAILDSAERAASVQDFASAEHYLRQAALIQEAQFGPGHPELANTLNNLGIVFERLGKPVDAEASYRRAYAIAKATLVPDDPLVMTSGQNLREFCAAAGRPFEIASPSVVAPAPVLATPSALVTATPLSPLPTTPAAPAAPPLSPLVAVPGSKPALAATPQGVVTTAPPAVPQAATQPVTPSSAKPVTKGPPRPAAKVASNPGKSTLTEFAAVAPRVAQSVPDTSPAAPATARSAVRAESTALTSRGTLVWIALAIATVVLALFAWLTSSSGPSDESNEGTATPPAASVAPPAAPAAAAAPESPREAPEPATAPIAQSRPTQSVTRDNVRAAADVSERRPAASGTVSLVEARLCQPLSVSDWQCTPVTNPGPPGGRLFFYTRVKAESDTTVQHRWYVNGGLLQTVNLRIRANSSEGFRTYSRNSITAERRGTWTIEVRDGDGALLHEERFVVQ